MLIKGSDNQHPKGGIMSRSRTLSTASALVAGLVIPLVGIGVASAAPVHWQRSVFAYGPEPSFCGGLTQQGVDTGRFRMVPRDGIGHYEAASKFVETWTNLDTGDFVTVKGSYKEHTIHATIDPDGIVTALSSGPGTATVYDSDGHMLAHWAGLNRVVYVVDQMGTPADPDDDAILSRTVVQRTGQLFDYCDPIIAAIG
jgi:hypothetical protein